MPSLPSKTRRKRITPIANLHEDDVWLRTFKLLGLEPLQPYPVSHTDSVVPACQVHYSDNFLAKLEPSMDPSILEEVDASMKTSPHLGFLDLPIETQTEIFKNVTSTELVALSLVSRHFRDLAAAQLYKNFHIVFPDEDDPSYESPIDGLAGGLDTFVTSDYDYAQYLKEIMHSHSHWSQYLKEIMLDTLSGGEKGERAYKHYTFDVSCGKFMNTLFLLTIRKAKALETFRWDLRVEISRPLYKALHALPALQHLHIRMHTGHSMYETPPLLQSTANIESDDTIATTSFPQSSHTSISFTSLINKTGSSKSTSSKDGKPCSKLDEFRMKEPPTISGFHNLKSLAVLDMDNLDYIDEIKECVRSSSSTLQKLKLSFSERLAMSARNPPPPVNDSEGDTSDEEVDEFGNTIVVLAATSSSDDSIGGPSKAYRANEERKIQEGVLARIFGVETFADKVKDGHDSDKSDNEAKKKKKDGNDEEKKKDEDPGKVWVDTIVELSTKFQKSLANHESLTAAQKDAITVIEKAARHYVEGIEEKKKQELETEVKKQAETTNINASTTSSEDASDSEEKSEPVLEAKADGGGPPVIPFRKVGTKAPAICDPDDIDLDAPEAQIDPKEFEEVPNEDVDAHDESEPLNADAYDLDKDITKQQEILISSAQQEVASGLKRMKSTFKMLEQQSKAAHAEAERVILSMDASHEPGHPPPSDKSQAQLVKLRNRLRTIGDSMVQVGTEMEMLQHKLKTLPPVAAEIGSYIRDTRGLQLKSLSIYLIPLRASVLTRVIDFTVLERLTLLNVGTQDRLWMSLQKMNAESPLPLKKIFSDQVTLQLLKVVSELNRVEELFLMEGREKNDSNSRRSGDKNRQRASQIAPKTTVTIESIRKLALKKHMSTLKRLIINNFEGSSWDANEQTVKLICRKGKELQELAIAMGVRATHTFNQYLPALTNLRAMHILFYRNDDHCPFVIREIRKFVVDCCASNPAMKLEYIALGTTVERIVRRAKKDAKIKEKEKEARLARKTTKEKGKEVLSMSGISNGSGGYGGLNFVSLDALISLSGSGDIEDESSSGSEDEDEDDDRGPGMRLETLEGVRFYDVYGVRIFCKDILGGWL